MTGNCTQECSEFGHSDSCWMPGQPSPATRRLLKGAPKLSTFVPSYQEMTTVAEGPEQQQPQQQQEQLTANGSPYGRGGGTKDCSGRGQGAEFHSAAAPAGQTAAKREIYL